MRFSVVVFVTGYGRREVVELLLANGASIQACDEGGMLLFCLIQSIEFISVSK